MITLCFVFKRLDLSFASNFELIFSFNFYFLMIMRYFYFCLFLRNLFYFDIYFSMKSVIILNDFCLIFVFYFCYFRVFIFVILIFLNSFILYCFILLLCLNFSYVGIIGVMLFYLVNLIEYN